MRVSIFVDGNNMFYTQKKIGWFFEPKKLIEYFTVNKKLVNAFWYQGIDYAEDKRGFINSLIHEGFTVRTKEIKRFKDALSEKITYKSNLDIEIVTDMFNTVDMFNNVVIFSGSGEFERAAELLRSHKVRVTVVSTEGMIARELRNAADTYIDLRELKRDLIRDNAYG